MPTSPHTSQRFTSVRILGKVTDGKIIQQFPLYGSSIKAGFPSPAEDWLEGKIDLNQYLVKNPAATYLLRVSGDSMKDAGIHSGDVLVVDCAKEAKHGDIIIACLDGEMTVKRLYRKGSKTALVPENELYNPITITGESDFTIWGVVVSCLKQF
jgi:DNA polymerase V